MVDDSRIERVVRLVLVVKRQICLIFGFSPWSNLRDVHRLSSLGFWTGPWHQRAEDTPALITNQEISLSYPLRQGGAVDLIAIKPIPSVSRLVLPPGKEAINMA